VLKDDDRTIADTAFKTEGTYWDFFLPTVFTCLHLQSWSNTFFDGFSNHGNYAALLRENLAWISNDAE